MKTIIITIAKDNEKVNKVQNAIISYFGIRNSNRTKILGSTVVFEEITTNDMNIINSYDSEVQNIFMVMQDSDCMAAGRKYIVTYPEEK